MANTVSKALFTKTMTNKEHLFESIYRRFQPQLRRYFATCFNSDDAEDLCQQLFMKIWLYQVQNPDFVPKDWRAWLFRAAVNLKNDHIRLLKALPQTFELIENEDSPADPLLLPDGADAQIDSMMIRMALYNLKERDRDLILLKYMGFSSGEIGTMLNLSASAVRSRSVTAKERFAKALRKHSH